MMMHKLLILVFLINSCQLLKGQNSQIEFVLADESREMVETASLDVINSYGDLVIVFFESGFVNSKVGVFINDHKFDERIVTSHHTADLAWSPRLISIEKIDYLGISIEDFRFSFPVKGDFQFYFVNKVGNKISIEYSNVFPAYD